MSEQLKGKEKIVKVFKNYGYYFLLGALILVMAIIMLVASVSSDTNSNLNTDVDSTPTASLSFQMPVLNASIVKGYSDSELQYNEMLNEWKIHKAIEFAANEGTNVLASLSGTVTSVYTNSLEGTVVVIDHGSNYQTVYGSLAENVNVEVGDIVSTGDVIGTASNSATNELDESHVHFEVWKDGSSVDPAGYLNIESK